MDRSHPAVGPCLEALLQHAERCSMVIILMENGEAVKCTNAQKILLLTHACLRRYLQMGVLNGLKVVLFYSMTFCVLLV